MISGFHWGGIPATKRFWYSVWPRGDCWEWRGTLTGKGYGKFTYGKSRTQAVAHRFSYEYVNGPLPKKYELHHLCSHKWCVRPSHLLPVTRLEHERLGHNARKTHCKRGHALNGENVRTYRGKRICKACMRVHSKIYERSFVDKFGHWRGNGFGKMLRQAGIWRKEA